MLKEKPRTIATDKTWDAPVSGDWIDHVFTRVSATKVRFTGVDFRYSSFDLCYLRECAFDSCDFTGCRFSATNFHRSTFIGCKFDYANFERTQIDHGILDNCCPPHENLKARFARTLRMNYQSLGDAESVNKAMLVELAATAEHLYKSWNSNDRYYRMKYDGVKRVRAFFQWAKFRALDVVWGNGEKPVKLLYTTMVVLALIALVDAACYRDPRLVASYWAALCDSPAVFLGTRALPLSLRLVTAVTFARLVLLSLFVSVLVRRFARR